MSSKRKLNKLTLKQTYALLLMNCIDVSCAREIVMQAGIAVADNNDRYKVLRQLTQLLDGLGIETPDEYACRQIAARFLVKKIAEGDIGPYEGAREIWWKIWTDCRQLRELSIFAGVASEIEDDPIHRTEYERDILAEARDFLANNTYADAE